MGFFGRLFGKRSLGNISGWRHPPVGPGGWQQSAIESGIDEGMTLAGQGEEKPAIQGRQTAPSAPAPQIDPYAMLILTYLSRTANRPRLQEILNRQGTPPWNPNRYAQGSSQWPE